jgi:hypothetical protein
VLVSMQMLANLIAASTVSLGSSKHILDHYVTTGQTLFWLHLTFVSPEIIVSRSYIYCV